MNSKLFSICMLCVILLATVSTYINYRFADETLKRSVVANDGTVAAAGQAVGLGVDLSGVGVWRWIALGGAALVAVWYFAGDKIQDAVVLKPASDTTADPFHDVNAKLKSHAEQRKQFENWVAAEKKLLDEVIKPDNPGPNQ